MEPLHMLDFDSALYPLKTAHRLKSKKKKTNVQFSHDSYTAQDEGQQRRKYPKDGYKDSRNITAGALEYQYAPAYNTGVAIQNGPSLLNSCEYHHCPL
jgi:hypothetical protein